MTNDVLVFDLDRHRECRVHIRKDFHQVISSSRKREVEVDDSVVASELKKVAVFVDRPVEIFAVRGKRLDRNLGARKVELIEQKSGEQSLFWEFGLHDEALAAGKSTSDKLLVIQRTSSRASANRNGLVAEVLETPLGEDPIVIDATDGTKGHESEKKSSHNTPTTSCRNLPQLRNTEIPADLKKSFGIVVAYLRHAFYTPAQFWTKRPESSLKARCS